MRTNDRKPRQKRKASTAMLTAVIMMIPMAGVAFYLLGRPLPEETANHAGTTGSPSLAWGDRVERRMDAFIDGIKPKWAKRVEKRVQPLKDKIGFE